MDNNLNNDNLSNDKMSSNKINDDRTRDDRTSDDRTGDYKISKLRIDMSLFKSVDGFHDFIKEILSLSPHYGKNLDALWDELSVRKAPVKLVFYNCNQVDETLSEYFPKLEALFEELHLDNEGIEAEFIDELII
jgi:ribonuclease inhibitor